MNAFHEICNESDMNPTDQCPLYKDLCSVCRACSGPVSVICRTPIRPMCLVHHLISLGGWNDVIYISIYLSSANVVWYLTRVSTLMPSLNPSFAKAERLQLPARMSRPYSKVSLHKAWFRCSNGGVLGGGASHFYMACCLGLVLDVACHLQKR
jgi:hypothetical protein